MDTVKTEGKGFFFRIFSFLNEKRKIVFFVLSAILLLLSTGAVFYFTVFPAAGYFHSDCTDTILWAQASYESGKVFSENFKYAALLPFGASVWLIPLIAAFGMTMNTHIIGMVIFELLFFAAILFLCRALKWNWTWSFFAVSVSALVLSASQKLREIMWQHVIYYSLGLLLLFATLIIIYKIINTEKTSKKKLWTLYILLFVFIMLSATNGLSSIATSILPAFGGLCAYIVFSPSLKELWQRIKDNKFLLGIIPVATVFGLVLLKFLKGDITAGYADGHMGFSPIETWPQNLVKLPSLYYTLLGVNINANAQGIESLLDILRIIAGTAILMLPLMAFVYYPKITDKATKILLWSNLALTAIIFVGCVCGKLAGANWRLTPILGSNALTSVVAVKIFFGGRIFSEKTRKIAVSRVIAVSALAIIMAFSSVSFVKIVKMPYNYGKDNDLHAIAQFLEENDLTYGYATFWRAQSVTLISDGDVKVRSINATENGCSAYVYQANYEWFENQDGVNEYFIVLERGEYEKVKSSSQWNNAIKRLDRVLEFKNYKVFVFWDNPIRL